MNRAKTRPPHLADRLAATLTVAEADVVGPLAVFPLIADSHPALEYLAFADARGRGVEIRELPGDASVNDLLVDNPLEVPVLLYQGEEVLGARQNRTFDVSVLVPARSAMTVPVSCVEEGRWDPRRHAEPFAPAPEAAYPELRRVQDERVRERLAAGAEPRAGQRRVWAEVAAKSARHRVASDTGALHDVFEDRRHLLAGAARAASIKCSEVGMLAAIAGRFVVLDFVSDADAFAALHDPLVAGYALDALDAPVRNTPAPSQENARDFVRLLLAAPVTTTAAVGMGQGLRFEFSGLAGTALQDEGELIALTAFS